MRYTVIVRSEAHQRMFQPYQGVKREEAKLIANLCVQAINTGEGEATVIIQICHGRDEANWRWTCKGGCAIEGGDALAYSHLREAA